MITTSNSLAPPAATIGLLGWLRRNLFSTWYNALLTGLALWLLWSLGTALWNFVTTAEWGVVTANLRLFMIGRYPVSEAWRAQAALSLLALLLGASWGVWGGIVRNLAVGVGALFLVLALLPFELDSRLWLAANLALIAVGFGLGVVTRARVTGVLRVAWLVSPFIVFGALYGIGVPPLLTVFTDLWGGLLLTLTLAVVGIVASFPLGVLLAVGRQSSFPAIRAFCTLYIELIRGVPLVTILFMMQIMLPLFLPEGLTVERVVRALIGFAVFTSAYLAENVRGGLQSIGHGQSEAARALGLNALQTLWLIVLPQALRAVIPALVGQFISLFKDTSLVAIVGLLDLTGIANSVVQQQAFLGRQSEVYLFIAAIYFVVAFSMSAASRRLEKVLGVGKR
ncbi:MAG: ABC transporter permease subunit [Chloroflexota bacterium]